MNFKEKEGVTLALSTRQSSHFDRGINYKLNLASKILAEANIRIQDKIEEMERMKLKDEIKGNEPSILRKEKLLKVC